MQPLRKILCRLSAGESIASCWLRSDVCEERRYVKRCTTTTFQAGESVSLSISSGAFTPVEGAMLRTLHRPTTESQPAREHLSQGTLPGTWDQHIGCHSSCCSQASCAPAMQARSTRQRTHRDTGAHIEAGRRARKRGVCVAESPYVGLIAAIVSSQERQLRVDGEVAPFG